MRGTQTSQKERKGREKWLVFAVFNWDLQHADQRQTTHSNQTSKWSMCIQLSVFLVRHIIHSVLYIYIFYFLTRNCWFLQAGHKHDQRETDMVSSSRSLHHRISPPYPTHGVLGLWAAALPVPSAGDGDLNHHIQEIQLLLLKDSPPIPCSLSLLSCPSFIVLPLSPWWLLFLTWGKQTLAFLLYFHLIAKPSANPRQNINPTTIFGVSEEILMFRCCFKK